ncbi:hypothetical protein [Bacteroides acidifaciens]|uniref:hypothetical protein n=2 Tax=Bacteroidales TaxID=171549 RepID=UPI00258D3948|nr:hypothetical protein [Bacteroides acidifaciens]
MMYPVLGFILSSIWTVAHLWKGTMNILGAILSVTFIVVTAYLSVLSYKEVKAEYKK